MSSEGWEIGTVQCGAAGARQACEFTRSPRATAAPGGAIAGVDDGLAGAQAARQILSMLVPPGAPMGSPQVMA